MFEVKYCKKCLSVISDESIHCMCCAEKGNSSNIFISSALRLLKYSAVALLAACFVTFIGSFYHHAMYDGFYTARNSSEFKSLSPEYSTFVYKDELWSGTGFSVDIERIAYSSEYTDVELSLNMIGKKYEIRTQDIIINGIRCGSEDINKGDHRFAVRIPNSSYEGAIKNLLMSIKIVNTSNDKVYAVSETLHPEIITQYK